MNTNLKHKVQVLGDPTRLAIFERLGEGPLAVVDIARGFDITRPAISQHLKILKDAGLVTGQKAGNRRLYRIDPKGVAELRDYFQDFWSEALASFKQVVEETENPP